MKTGLVLGKFAPFHAGHQLLVERALSECARVIALVYDATQTTSIPLSTRAQWLRDLYPHLEVIESPGAPEETGRDPGIMARQEAWIQKAVPAKITHFYSSEWYGEHVSRVLGAVDVRVDEARQNVPISGTQVRENPYARRRQMAPRVYFDLLTKVVLVGAESTGKSTLAKALGKHFETVDVPEHGRDYWRQHKDADGLLTRGQLVDLAVEHRELEYRLSAGAKGFIFIDTDARITRQYARLYHESMPPELHDLAEQCGTRYDLTVLCENDFGYVEDGCRAGAERQRKAQEELRSELTHCTHPVLVVRGAIEERLKQVCNALDQNGLRGFKQ